MKRIIQVFTVILLFGNSVIFARDLDASASQDVGSEISKGSSKKEVTFLVYMAADNDLYPFVKSDIAQMRKVGSNNRLNILVYVNTKFPGKPKFTRKIFIDSNGKEVQCGADERRDGGDPRTLIDACKWAHTDYPSDKFVLVLWDHGTGSLNRILGGEMQNCCSSWWQMCTACPVNIPPVDQFSSEWDQGSGVDERAVCFDFSTGSFFTDAKLSWALSEVCTTMRKGKKIDIVAFDACLMADIEIAHILHPYADYMVASQEVIPGTGYGYDKALRPLAQSTMSARDMAVSMVEAYKAEYKEKHKDYTLSAVDLSKIPAIGSMVTATSHDLIFGLTDKFSSQMKVVLKEASHPNNCTHFHEISYLDIDHLLDNLQKRFSAASFLPSDAKQKYVNSFKQLQNAFESCIIANVSGKVFPRAKGLSIYFPMRGIDATYPGLIWSKDTAWNSFLKVYFAARCSWEYAGIEVA